MSSESLWAIGRRQWPFEVPPVELESACAHFALGPDSDATEVYLAVGCQLGIAAALHGFEADYLAVAPPLLRRQGMGVDGIAEILQSLRASLLVPRAGEPYIRLLRYAGTGRLRSLVRVSAARAAARTTRREVLVGDTDAVLGDLWSTRDPELHVIDAQAHSLFKTCFQRALLVLSDQERVLMRLCFVEELSYQQIAALFGVNRSTICRQLAAARSRLMDRLAAEWRGLTSEPVEPAVADLLEGEIDLSLSRLLRA